MKLKLINTLLKVIYLKYQYLKNALLYNQFIENVVLLLVPLTN